MRAVTLVRVTATAPFLQCGSRHPPGSNEALGLAEGTGPVGSRGRKGRDQDLNPQTTGVWPQSPSSSPTVQLGLWTDGPQYRATGKSQRPRQAGQRPMPDPAPCLRPGVCRHLAGLCVWSCLGVCSCFTTSVPVVHETGFSARRGLPCDRQDGTGKGPCSPNGTKLLGRKEPSAGLWNVKAPLGVWLGSPRGACWHPPAPSQAVCRGWDLTAPGPQTFLSKRTTTKETEKVERLPFQREEPGPEQPCRHHLNRGAQTCYLPAQGAACTGRGSEDSQGPRAQPTLLGRQWAGHSSLASGLHIPTGPPAPRPGAAEACPEPGRQSCHTHMKKSRQSTLCTRAPLQATRREAHE